ncbi:MAG TPA: hypothetical protein VHU13_05185 [Solirubrobacteraceae bacterium]|jgi:hypothetical protein|nr:hypothetical protein [Solirubrobacteraceae bacterium]
MATRAIVTSQPVIACDVCGRRLLRGETPDLFLAGGQRRVVCELCVPRATAEGWRRESDELRTAVRPPHARRGGSLLGRLRQLREGEQRPLRRETVAGRRREPIEDAGFYESEEQLYGFLDEPALELDPGNDRALHVGSVRADDQPPPAADPGQPDAAFQAPQVGSGEVAIARALEVFNAGATTQRVAGVARSLGAPTIVVRAIEGNRTRVSILVAWELCWYRYEVDLEEQAAGVQLVAEGMELDELAAEELQANASADERGRIALAGA